MTIVLFDDSARDSLLPLTFTRPVAALRVGILTIAEKWARCLKGEPSYLTAQYLQEKFKYTLSDDNIFINGSVCPDPELLEAIDTLQEGDALMQQDVLVAVKLPASAAAGFSVNMKGLRALQYEHKFVRIVHPEDVFLSNDIELRKDYSLLTFGRTSASLSATNTVLGDQIFVEEGAVAECSTFNTLQGPIYLGARSEVWEGCSIRGAFALCHDSQVKMGAKIYSKTTIGPFCRIGGEVNNAVIQAFSSKGHEGYLGNSVVGEWCNLGADSNNSNLKNNYAPVKLWDYSSSQMRSTGLQFCGLIMADHAKCGINTMFNTGTVAGVGANVFGGGFPPNFIPDFSWGGAEGLQTHLLEKAFETVERVFERRGRLFDDTEKQILSKVFDLTKHYRNF
ncbi:GlmU family protein [Arcticibacter sp. MXS-1]|uniref:GlmU family protein n=1 Tax=Arcticibacter sp. MXS-1 TaxID=3341726 RepID=UPI0035A98A69